MGTSGASMIEGAVVGPPRKRVRQVRVLSGEERHARFFVRIHRSQARLERERQAKPPADIVVQGLPEPVQGPKPRGYSAETSGPGAS
ncbi:hypothetical protein [Sinomonas terrae]|uniref:Uncharacterized protein n=1 Tax=Sinomonas terrae TaxID=2908838 RepID=A0ABS9U4E3_9MICC|nr:hypothetical protein [Sinomonas terrae]MCH6471556.1 hypothetical protein [Sinomonas terrae]